MQIINAHQALAGIYSALITPMHDDESINYHSLRKLVDYELATGVEGFYCCGSSGEGLLLSLEERKKILETVLEAVNGAVPVISHIGTLRTSDVIELAKHAKQAGASAVSMIPPYYYKFSMDEIIDYYIDTAYNVPDLPVIVYNIPGLTGVSFDKVNAARLLEDPRIIGLKHTSTDLYSLERIRDKYPDKIFFNGFDEIFLSGLAQGANAAIGTTVNLFPEQFKIIRDLYQAGNMAEALTVQSKINMYIEGMMQAGIFSAVKYMFSLRGIECGPCRKPFKPLSEGEKKKLMELSAV